MHPCTTQLSTHLRQHPWSCSTHSHTNTPIHPAPTTTAQFNTNTHATTQLLHREATCILGDSTHIKTLCSVLAYISGSLFAPTCNDDVCSQHGQSLGRLVSNPSISARHNGHSTALVNLGIGQTSTHSISTSHSTVLISATQLCFGASSCLRSGVRTVCALSTVITSV